MRKEEEGKIFIPEMIGDFSDRIFLPDDPLRWARFMQDGIDDAWCFSAGIETLYDQRIGGAALGFFPDAFPGGFSDLEKGDGFGFIIAKDEIQRIYSRLAKKLGRVHRKLNWTETGMIMRAKIDLCVVPETPTRIFLPREPLEWKSGLDIVVKERGGLALAIFDAPHPGHFVIAIGDPNAQLDLDYLQGGKGFGFIVTVQNGMKLLDLLRLYRLADVHSF